MNTIRKSSQVFMDFFSTLLLALLYEYLSGTIKIDKHEWIGEILSVIIAVVMVVFARYIFNFFYDKFHFLRKYIDPIATYEGAWICYTGIKGRPISIFNVNYNSHKHIYEYYGKAYDCNADYKGDWYSDELTYLSEGGFRFYARGHFLENDNLLSTESSGYVIFRKNGRTKGEYIADGYTVDWCANNGCFKTLAEKITKSFLMTTIKRESIENGDDEQALIKYYCDENFEPKESISKNAEGLHAVETQTELMMQIYKSNIYLFDRISRHEDYKGNLSAYLNNIFDWTDKVVFEAGVGTGRNLDLYIDKAKKVYVTDISPLMISETKKRFESYKNKIVSYQCDHKDLDILMVEEKADIFISSYSFGHSFIDSKESLKEAFKCLMDGCISKVKSGGFVVIIENQSIFGEPLSYDYKLQNFFHYLSNYGFNHNVIDTDYEFTNTNEAYEFMNAFFGPEIGEKIRERGVNIIPEKTIIWYKQIQ